MPASDHLTFLVNEHGRPFPAVNFSAWFRDCCAEAGVPAGYTPHGLRKASAKMHADRGATTHMLMAWHGWLSIGEAERYTRGADRRLLSAAAGKLAEPDKERLRGEQVSNPTEGWTIGGPGR